MRILFTEQLFITSLYINSNLFNCLTIIIGHSNKYIVAQDNAEMTLQRGSVQHTVSKISKICHTEYSCLQYTRYELHIKRMTHQLEFNKTESAL